MWIFTTSRKSDGSYGNIEEISQGRIGRPSQLEQDLQHDNRQGSCNIRYRQGHSGRRDRTRVMVSGIDIRQTIWAHASQVLRWEAAHPIILPSFGHGIVARVFDKILVIYMAHVAFRQNIWMVWFHIPSTKIGTLMRRDLTSPDTHSIWQPSISWDIYTSQRGCIVDVSCWP